MPIYGENKTLIPITEQELITEGIFQGDPPKGFLSFAKSFASKIDRKFDVKPMGIEKAKPTDFIKDNPRLEYQFNIEHELYNPVIATGKVLAKGIAADTMNSVLPGVGGMIFGGNNVSNEIKAIRYAEELSKRMSSSIGMKKHAPSEVFYQASPDKKYVYLAYPHVVMKDGYFTEYCIILKCAKYKKWAKRLGLKESAIETEIPGLNYARGEDGKVDLSSLFAGFEDLDLSSSIVDNEELREYHPYPGLKAAFNEYFNISDTTTRRQLMAMNEVEHNTTLTALTSKLYDQIVSKAHNIDFGEIPKTKGDITKLSTYETLIDTLAIIKGIVTEYKQDTKPIDEISIAISNIQARKDMFMRAFRANSEMPILIYDNMVMAVVVGTSHLITACIEFIKAPKDESFTIQLDKIAYAKSKDHLIYGSISKFNHICQNGDFDKAMNMILDQKIRKFTGITVGAGIVGGIIILTNIIPLLRELVYLFYHTRVSVSDYCEAQADLLAMNAYNLEHNDISSKADKSDIVKKQQGIADKFRKMANFFAIKDKKAEVEATKDIENVNKKYKLDQDANIIVDEPDEDTSGSALF